MEEIDIIELLKRVKEGKAPKLIEIENEKYSFFENYATLDEIYDNIEQNNFWGIDTIELDTKIKILDKPIIEKLDEVEIMELDQLSCRIQTIRKINEIIRHINKGEK